MSSYKFKKVLPSMQVITTLTRSIMGLTGEMEACAVDDMLRMVRENDDKI